MEECKHLLSCPFFNDELADMPTVAGWLKKQYCQGAFQDCARYRVNAALGPGQVPANLFPNERQRAESLGHRFLIGPHRAGGSKGWAEETW
jgi:hypothetical protein